MSRHIIYLLTVALLAVAACAPSARPTQKPVPQSSMPVTTTVAPTAPSANAPAQTQPSSVAVANVTSPRVAVPTVEPTFAPNPRNVQVKTDTKINASAVISTTGGTLSVQAADGTQFTLTFPKGALLKDTKVTLTPLTNVDGLPFSGGLVGGVQIAPEGLRLLEPATLTIESSKTVAAKGFETIAFAYHQNGEGMYLRPSSAKGNVLTLEVWHFSGAGAAQGTAAEIQGQQQNVPANSEDALAQRVADYLEQQREAQLRGEKRDPDFEKKMIEFAREWYDRFIAPQLPMALQNCEAAPEILSKALSWLRQVTLLGIEKEFGAEGALIKETMFQAIVNCYNKEYDQCVIDNDIKHRTAMLGLLRDAMLLGIGDRLDSSKVYKCPRHFTVDQAIADGRGHLTGNICGLAEPFTLSVNGSNAAGGEYVGTFTFAPADIEGGSWIHKATITCLPELGCGTVAASSTYKVAGGADGKVTIVMNETTQTTSFGGGALMPSWQFELQPATGACSAQ